VSYKRAEEILPDEIIELIQQYVDGQSIYIPRKAENRRGWGNSTEYRTELDVRNCRIREEFAAGISIAELAERYYLSEKSIRRILREFE